MPPRAIRKVFEPTKPTIALDDDGVTLRHVTRYWPPWNRRWEERTLTWREITRITVEKWDRYIYDTIVVIFEAKDGTRLFFDEDMPDFHSSLERFLPRVFPDIGSPEDWFEGVRSSKPFENCPTVIYEAEEAKVPSREREPRA